jgi:hypothetical protein
MQPARRVCFWHAVTIGAAASVLVAALDLKEVQLLRAAMRIADRQDRRCDRLLREPKYEPRQVIHPEPRYEPRPVIHPTPRYEARPIIHPRPVFEPNPIEPCEVHPKHKPFLQAPWQVMPWEKAPEPPRTIKVVIKHVDTVLKGSLIDCFL